MVYGFWCESEANNRACIVLPKLYEKWIEDYGYPSGNTKIRTLDSKVFDIKVLKIGGKWFFYNGWRTMITELRYPSGCNFLFQYEDNLRSFRMITFHQDAVYAPGNFFYCRLSDPYTTEKRLHLSCYVVHGLMNNLLPKDPIAVRAAPRKNFQIQLAVDDGFFYVTKGWPFIKESFGITPDHLIVFEIIDQSTYNMSVFEQNKLTLPPELKWEAEVKEEDDDEDYFDEDIIILSTDDSDEVLVSDESSEEDEEDTDMEEEDDDSEEEEDVGVPVVFVVDKHYRMKTPWARENRLCRKRGLSILDGEGLSWGVSVGREGEPGKYRWYIKGMSAFVADKNFQLGDQMHFLFFQKQGVFKFSNVVRGSGS